MDISEANKLKEEIAQSKLNVSEVFEDFAKNTSKSESAGILQNLEVGSDRNALQVCQSITENLANEKNNQNFVKLKTNHSDVPMTGNGLSDQISPENLGNVTVSGFLNSSAYLKSEQYEGGSRACEEQSKAIIKVAKPLCADYKSDSDCESVDSESDSSTISTSTTVETSSESEDYNDSSSDSNTGKGTSTKLNEIKSKKDLMLLNLPSIEDLRISVPEDACIDIGIITNIVDVLVVVESYKGTAALDLDTVLFLDQGKRTLGKVFDILGPITEPIYTVRFNSQEQISNNHVKKGLKVYFAPKTEHTNFVFMTEVLKNRGTDASWKDNVEAPPEFQDFSDDEEEKLHKSKQTKDSNEMSSDLKEQNKSRKRSFSQVKQTSGVLQPSRCRNLNSPQGMQNFQRNSSSRPRPNISGFIRSAPFPYNPTVFPPHMPLPPRFSGPPFPSFGCLSFVSQNQNFHRPFYQPRAHPFHQTFGPWERSMFRPLHPLGPPPLPPPPPPPPIEENDQQFASYT